MPEYITGTTPTFDLKKLTRGDSGIEVYYLQCKLKELGYYNGKCSGTFLDGTRNAVKAFQKDHKMSQNGVATVDMQKVMYAEGLATPVPVATATPNPTAAPTPTMTVMTTPMQ